MDWGPSSIPPSGVEDEREGEREREREGGGGGREREREKEREGGELAMQLSHQTVNFRLKDCKL